MQGNSYDSELKKYYVHMSLSTLGEKEFKRYIKLNNLDIKDYKNITKEILVEFLIFNKKDIVSSSNGSVFNNLKTEILKEYRIFVPEKNMINRLSSLFQKLNNQLLIRGKKHQKLEELKDLLLTKMTRVES